jgi:predicted small secreted protein
VEKMNWKSLAIGLAAGAAGTYLLQRTCEQKMDAEKALETVKRVFKQNGTVSGSWIETTKKTFHKDELFFEGYQGGITRSKNGLQEHYEFFVDSVTGSLIEFKKIG